MINEFIFCQILLCLQYRVGKHTHSQINALYITELFPGQFGKVYKANLKQDVKQIKVAIKTIRYTSEKETQDFMREMNIMADMMHPNIIRLYGLVNEGQSLQGAFWAQE